MSAADIIATITAALMVLMFVTYIKKYASKVSKTLEVKEFIPMAAWLRAGMFFCFFYLVSWATGTMEAILSTPIFTDQQLDDPVWLSSVFALFAFILFAYWGIWARYTIRFERKLDLVPQIIFGLVWGTAFGQMFIILASWFINWS